MGDLKNLNSPDKKNQVVHSQIERNKYASNYEKYRTRYFFLPYRIVVPRRYRRKFSEIEVKLKERTINDIWDMVCEMAKVTGRTPHSARHGRGKHLFRELGPTATDRMLGHKNISTAMQYARFTSKEIQEKIDNRYENKDKKG